MVKCIKYIRHDNGQSEVFCPAHDLFKKDSQTRNYYRANLKIDFNSDDEIYAWLIENHVKPYGHSHELV